MAIKSILLAYSGDAVGSGALHLAIQMARKYGAHLTGVVSHGPALSEVKYNRYMSQQLLDLLHSRDAEAVATLRQGFEDKTQAELPDGAALFLDLETRPDFTLIEAARAYDIVVMGRRAFEPGHEHFGAKPEQIALDSGRPVILVPHTYSTEALNEHAVFAWDGKRAAARALADAMHILETKDLVTVLTVGDVTHDRHQGDDIQDLLTRHGIKVNRLTLPKTARSIAETILDACRDAGAGLLVMGAYEHSATHEALFGGPTADILADAHLPVLMSH